VNDIVLRTIGAGGRRGTKIATIICALVVQGAELGELEEYEIPDPDNPDPDAALKKCRGFRREWLDRLRKAIETDAVDYLSSDRIVEILLQG
jgi:hypothetical protein